VEVTFRTFHDILNPPPGERGHAMFGPGIKLFERDRVYHIRLSRSGIISLLTLLTLGITIRSQQGSYMPPRAGYPGPMMMLAELEILRETISEREREAGGHPLEEAMEAVDMDVTAKTDDFPEEIDGTDEREIAPPEDEPRPGQGEGKHLASDDASILPITSDEIVLLRFVKATYPIEARLMGIEGRFLIEALIGAAGTVLEARAAQDDVNETLVKAARNAVLKWRFAPILTQGKPSQFWVQIPFNFIIGERRGT